MDGKAKTGFFYFEHDTTLLWLAPFFSYHLVPERRKEYFDVAGADLTQMMQRLKQMLYPLQHGL